MFEGRVGTLRRFKDDANEVRAGLECGIRLDGFDGYKEGDVIECFEVQKVRAAL
jgi:translation initiation factor IF-2